jgi:hypothetical protein
MRALAVLLFVAGALHVAIHLPVLPALVGALILWGLWKLRWVLLGIFGLEMLFGGGDDA